MKKPFVKPDERYPTMWRVHWPDGEVSDMVNLTRANDAVRSWLATDGRRKRARAAQGRLAGDPLSDAPKVGKRTSRPRATQRRGG